MSSLRARLLRRSGLAAVVVALMAGGAGSLSGTAAAAAPATAVPATAVPSTAALTAPVALPVVPPGLSAVPLDPATPYVPQNSCDGVIKPGVVAFERLVRATYPSTGSSGDIRPCGTDGPVSEHYDGRAWDWAVSVADPGQKAVADALTGWLIANNGEMARRFGLMYIIWNDRIWGVYSAAAGWRSYGGCPTGNATACHEDHVHFSFGWAGARGRTSWWSGRPATADYGPCRVPALTYAPAYGNGANTVPCPTVAAAPAGTPLQQWSGAVLRLGDYGPAVPPVQQALGVATTGTVDVGTDAALRRFQQVRGLLVSGATDTATWGALLGLPGSRPGFINGHQVQGAILAEYLALGGTGGVLGVPTTEELTTPDGVGRFTEFTGGAIYWTPATGAHEIHGAVLAHWTQLGRETGVLGYPTTDETGTPDGVGRYNYFTGGGIYWTAATGPHEVRGAILGSWARYGFENGLGYPVTDESGTPDGVGRYNHFSRATSVYWTPATGAHAVVGAVRAAWAASGWEAGSLGYPSSEEYDVPGGRRSDFVGGWLRWDRVTGAVTMQTAQSPRQL
ncbi:MAG: peptidoglycan-binding protein [Actinomycetota bacterium]|nr:peptidoglycan-binding protein [Actinomycetota bacterium]